MLKMMVNVTVLTKCYSDVTAYHVIVAPTACNSCYVTAYHVIVTPSAM